MSFFGVGGDRFRPNKDHTPGVWDRPQIYAVECPQRSLAGHAGPGDYDPSKAKGFKADPKSGFLTGNRFHEMEKEGWHLAQSFAVTLAGLNLLASQHKYAKLCFLR